MKKKKILYIFISLVAIMGPKTLFSTSLGRIEKGIIYKNQLPQETSSWKAVKKLDSILLTFKDPFAKPPIVVISSVGTKTNPVIWSAGNETVEIYFKTNRGEKNPRVNFIAIEDE